MKTLLVILAIVLLAPAQSKPQKQAPESLEITELRNEFIQATKGYKASLEKLAASYQKDVTRAQDRLTQAQSLYAQGLISISELEASGRAVTEAQEKVKEVRKRAEDADKQIAETLANEEQVAKEFKKAKVKRTSTRQRPCSNWTLTASQRQTKRSISVTYKFVCLD